MYRIKTFISKLFPHDKLMHFMIGTYITIATEPFMAWWQSLIITFIIALGIEVWDYISEKGTAEIMDIVYTLAAWVSTMFILFLGNLIKMVF